MVIIKNLDKLNEVVNIDNFVQGIIPSLVEISDNNNWRVRAQVEETVPVFARIVKFFSKSWFSGVELFLLILWPLKVLTASLTK